MRVVVQLDFPNLSLAASESVQEQRAPSFREASTCRQCGEAQPVMKPQEGESQPLVAGERLSHGEGTWRVLAACIGFLADSYDLFTIDLVVLILQLEYGELLVSARAKAMMVSAMLAGVVIGQLAFGYVADWLGRKWAFVTTAALTILGALSCSLCSGPATLPIQMSVCRFFLGLGVGGEYPLSATETRPHWFLCSRSN